MSGTLTETELRHLTLSIAKELTRLVEEEFAPNGCEVAPKWKGGKLVIHPGNETQPKEIPFDIFYKKILSVRDSLRLIEQKLGALESIGDDEKASLQSYLSRAYGSLTSFNVLFKEESDKFVGQGKVKEAPILIKKTLPRSPLNEF